MTPERLSLEEFNDIYNKVPRLTAEVILQVDGGIVLTKRAIEPYKGLWHFPGGTVLKGETVNEAIERVAEEELGVRVVIQRLVGIVEYDGIDGKQPIGIAYLTSIESGTLRGSEQGEEVGVFQSLPEGIIPEQGRFLKEHLQKL